MTKRTRENGLIGESKVLTKLLELEYVVSIPFGGIARYDLIAEKNGIVKRIQVKTRALQDTYIHIDLVSSTNKRRYSKEDIDEIWVYCPDNDSIYRLDVDKLKNSRSITLRIKKNKLSMSTSNDARRFLVE